MIRVQCSLSTTGYVALTCSLEKGRGQCKCRKLSKITQCGCEQLADDVGRGGGVLWGTVNHWYVTEGMYSSFSHHSLIVSINKLATPLKWKVYDVTYALLLYYTLWLAVCPLKKNKMPGNSSHNTMCILVLRVWRMQQIWNYDYFPRILLWRSKKISGSVHRNWRFSWVFMREILDDPGLQNSHRSVPNKF